MDRNRSMTPVQRADVAAKRRAVRTITTAMALGAVLYFGVQRWLVDVAAHEPPVAARELVLVLRWATVAVAAVVGGYGAYVFRLGSRVVSAHRFPPPSMATLKDVPVLDGAEAVRRGRLLQVVAATLGLLAAILVAVAARVSVLLARL